MTDILPDLDFPEDTPVAVALSGGPDSMALVHTLSQKTGHLHALTIDHGLRQDSAAEAAQIAEWVSDWPLTHTILTWDGDKPATRLMEAARTARYKLMANYCRAHDIHDLYLAHHQDDQGETVLFRLAKGSGLDGLAGMQARQAYNRHLTLRRPLLNEPKQVLIDYCDANHLAYVQDPSNQNPQFARPRLREARAALEAEGLSNKRLATTAARIRRALDALEMITDNAFTTCTHTAETELNIDLDKLRTYPDDIRLRVLRKAIEHQTPERAYSPRLEKIENLHDQIWTNPSFSKTTLAHLIIEKTSHGDGSWLHISPETC